MADSHQPLGRGAARGLQPARGDARRGGLPRLPVVPARRVLRARRRGPLPRLGPSARARSRSSAPSRRPAATSPSRSPSTRCGSPARSGRSTRRSRAQRHFPAIDWNRSYTLYDLADWFEREVAADWEEHRAWARELLQREAQLLEIVQLLGADTLAAPERVVLRTGRLLREDFLQQSAFDEHDAYCDPRKQLAMLRVIRCRRRRDERRGGPRRVGRARQAPRRRCAALARMREWPAPTADGERRRRLIERIERELEETRMTTLYTTEHRTVTLRLGPAARRRARRAASPTTSSSRSSHRTGSAGAVRCSRSRATG